METSQTEESAKKKKKKKIKEEKGEEEALGFTMDTTGDLSQVASWPFASVSEQVHLFCGSCIG
jgi:hypothetical protein